MLGRKNKVRTVFFINNRWSLNNAAMKMDAPICAGMMISASWMVCHSTMFAVVSFKTFA
jgi:hypothetical protein